MRKYLVFTVIAVLFVVAPTQAQFKFGLKAGVNLSDVSFSKDDISPDNYTGFQVGPMIEFTVPVVGVGLDVALLYSQTGFKVDSKTIEGGDLLLPINFKYKLSLPFELAGAYATTGPYAGINLFSDEKFTYKNVEAQIKSESFMFGWNFGLGVEFLGKVQVGVNYQLGITDDFSSIKTDDTTILDVKNGKARIWSITAAYFF